MGPNETVILHVYLHGEQKYMIYLLKSHLNQFFKIKRNNKILRMIIIHNKPGIQLIRAESPIPEGA